MTKESDRQSCSRFGKPASIVAKGLNHHGSASTMRRRNAGEVAERLNALVLKTSKG